MRGLIRLAAAEQTGPVFGIRPEKKTFGLKEACWPKKERNGRGPFHEDYDTLLFSLAALKQPLFTWGFVIGRFSAALKFEKQAQFSGKCGGYGRWC